MLGLLRNFWTDYVLAIPSPHGHPAIACVWVEASAMYWCCACLDPHDQRGKVYIEFSKNPSCCLLDFPSWECRKIFDDGSPHVFSGSGEILYRG